MSYHLDLKACFHKYKNQRERKGSRIKAKPCLTYNVFTYDEIHRFHVLEIWIEINVYVPCKLIINLHNDQLPLCLIAQLEEHLSGIGEVRVQIPTQDCLSSA